MKIVYPLLHMLKESLALASAVYPDIFSMNSTQEKDTSKSLTTHKSLQRGQSQGGNYNKQRIQVAQKFIRLCKNKQQNVWRNAMTDSKHCDTNYLREIRYNTLFSF